LILPRFRFRCSPQNCQFLWGRPGVDSIDVTPTFWARRLPNCRYFSRCLWSLRRLPIRWLACGPECCTSSTAWHWSPWWPMCPRPLDTWYPAPAPRRQWPCPWVPADFYVQVLAVVPGREIESRDRIAKICDNFAISKVARDMEQLLATKNLDKPLEQPENGYTYKATWFMQFRAVLWRSWLSVLKEPLLVKVRLIQTTVSGSGGNKWNINIS